MQGICLWRTRVRRADSLIWSMPAIWLVVKNFIAGHPWQTVPRRSKDRAGIPPIGHNAVPVQQTMPGHPIGGPGLMPELASLALSAARTSPFPRLSPPRGYVDTPEAAAAANP